jgi:hypothetical protein
LRLVDRKCVLRNKFNHCRLKLSKKGGGNDKFKGKKDTNKFTKDQLARFIEEQKLEET